MKSMIVSVVPLLSLGSLQTVKEHKGPREPRCSAKPRFVEM